MIKRTLYFGNPAYLKTKDEQLVFESTGTGEIKLTSIENIGVLILNHQQITISQALIAKLLSNNIAFIVSKLTIDRHGNVSPEKKRKLKLVKI